MEPKTDNITFDDCEYIDKYKSMGVTARELYCRQNKICYLTMSYVENSGQKEYGDIYCTDGKEFALTADMLNPTYECAACMTDFTKHVLETNEMTKKLDNTIVGLLVKIGESKSKYNSNIDLYMLKETFEFLEEHFNNTTMFSSETSPTKVTASGDILMFGAKVNFLDTVAKDSIMIEPGGLTFQV